MTNLKILKKGTTIVDTKTGDWYQTTRVQQVLDGNIYVRNIENAVGNEEVIRYEYVGYPQQHKRYEIRL